MVVSVSSSSGRVSVTEYAVCGEYVNFNTTCFPNNPSMYSKNDFSHANDSVTVDVIHTELPNLGRCQQWRNGDLQQLFGRSPLWEGSGGQSEKGIRRWQRHHIVPYDCSHCYFGVYGLRLSAWCEGLLGISRSTGCLLSVARSLVQAIGSLIAPLKGRFSESLLCIIGWWHWGCQYPVLNRKRWREYRLF